MDAAIQQTLSEPKNNAALAIKNAFSSGKVNNTTANAIIQNEVLSGAFYDVTGIKLSGTTEQKRQTIRDAARRWSQSQSYLRKYLLRFMLQNRF